MPLRRGWLRHGRCSAMAPWGRCFMVAASLLIAAMTSSMSRSRSWCGVFMPSTSRRVRRSSRRIPSGRTASGWSGMVWPTGCASSIPPASGWRGSAWKSCRRSRRREAFVAGALGPLGVRLEPAGKVTREEAYHAFADQVRGAGGGRAGSGRGPAGDRDDGLAGGDGGGGSGGADVRPGAAADGDGDGGRGGELPGWHLAGAYGRAADRLGRGRCGL